MLTFHEYPFASYVPNKILAACFSTIVGISLSFWIFQSFQNRFQPPRISFLLAFSHLTIFIELILRASVDPSDQETRTFYIVVNTLFVMGQRMIIVANFVFLTIIQREKSRSILICVIVCVVTSGILMSPATFFSFDSNQINTSYIFRILSALILLLVTISFYPIYFLRRTSNDISQPMKILIALSSCACFIAALFTLIQSFRTTYDKINSNESWFYAFQMTPIILAHCTWSILHPKRTLRSFSSSIPLLQSTDD